MRIYITDKATTKTISLRVFDSCNLGPDVLPDLAVSYLNDYPISYEDSVEHDASCAMTAAEFKAEAAWWQHEVDLYNDRSPYSWFVEGLGSDEIEAEYARGTEYVLYVDEG